MIKKISLILCLVFSLIKTPLAAPKEINLGTTDTTNLQKIYDFYDYKNYLPLPNYEIPPIYLQSFPTDYKQITDEKIRHSLFIRILSPLAHKLNQEILAERQQVEEIEQDFKKNQDITPEQSQTIETLAKKYDIFTRLKGHQRNTFLLSELLFKIGQIPPSFMIAIAAMETNWGTSRIVKEGNALYKQLDWNTDQGLKPVGETEDDSYRIKTYPNLYAAMQAYALRLNSHYNFKTMRYMREQLQYFGRPLTGTTYAYTLIFNSPLKNYAGMLEYTIAFYELNIIDKSKLNSKMIEIKPTAEINKLIKKDTKL